MLMNDASALLDPLIKTADQSGAPTDYGTLFAAMRHQEVFFSTSPDRQQAVLTPGADGRSVVRFFTSRRAALLGRFYAGITWENALRMVVRMPESDGLILQNVSGHAIAITGDAVRALLASQP